MTKLFYWRSAIGDPLLLETHREIINDVLNGRYGRRNLEKLTGYRVFSLRLNEKSRLLFTTHEVGGKSYLLVLEHLPNHEYSRSHFLKSGMLARYLEQNSTELVAAALHAENFKPFNGSFNMSEASAEANAPLVPLDYFNEQFIELNPSQECARKMVLPGVISGSAGSGKSCTVLSMLIEDAGLHQQTVLYVTKSKRLAYEMSRVWAAQPCHQINPDLVEFKTYTELLSETLEDNPDGITILSSSADKFEDVDLKTIYNAESSPIHEDFNHFHNWYLNYVSLYQKELKLRKMATSPAPIDRALDASTAYREFRICSAYSQQQYCELGVKNTSLADEQQKKWLYKAYNSYLEYLKDNHLMHPSFTPLRRATPYFRVIVDEAQDFSQLQLDALLALAQDNAIVYCMDSHQMLFDSISSRALLLQRLFDKFGKPASHTTLETSYRCPASVARAVNVIIRLKHITLGGTIDKFESQAIHALTNPSKGPGYFYLFTPEELLQKQWFKILVKNKDFAMVTTEQNREAVCQWLLRGNIEQPIVYTAAEIKGREYRVILALNMCSDTQVLRRIPEGVAAKDNSTAMHRAKNKGSDKYSDADNALFLKEMNELHVACTRASETLIVCDDKNHLNSALLDALKDVETPGESLFMSQATQSSSDEWKTYAEALYHDGQYSKSEAIFLSNVKNGEKAFASFLADYQTQRAEKSPPITPASKPVESTKAVAIAPKNVMLSTSSTPRTANVTKPPANKKVATPVGLSSAPKSKDSKIKPKGKSELEIMLPTFTFSSLLHFFIQNPTAPIHQLIADKPDCLHYLLGNDEITTEFINCLKLLRDFREKILTTKFIQQLIIQDVKIIPASRINRVIEAIVDAEPKLITQGNIAIFLAKIDSTKTFCKVYSEGITLIKSRNNNDIPACISEKITRGDAISALRQIKELSAKSNKSLAHEAAAKNAINILIVLGGLGIDIGQNKTNIPSPLFPAAQFGSIEALRIMHSFGVSLDEAITDGATIAHIAAEFGQIEVLKLLHSYQVNLNREMPHHHATPAFIAAQYEHIDFLKLLHQYGVDLAQRKKDDGLTLAFVAAQRGYVSILRLLNSFNISLNEPSINGVTPVYAATKEGQLAVLKFFHEKGFNLALVKRNGQTLAHTAATYGHIHILKLLHGYGLNLDITRDDEATPALLAAQNGQAGSLETLKECGANLHQRRKSDGLTIAHAAAQCGHPAILEVLHFHNISLDQPMNDGTTPAFVAAGQNNLPILKQLYHCGVNLAKGRAGDGATIAILAAQEGYIPMLQMLHTFKIPLDEPMDDGTTPAYVATEKGHIDVLKFLHSIGVDLAKTISGGIPLAKFAAVHNKQDIVTLLERYKKKSSNPSSNLIEEQSITNSYTTNPHSLNPYRLFPHPLFAVQPPSIQQNPNPSSNLIDSNLDSNPIEEQPITNSYTTNPHSLNPYRLFPHPLFAVQPPPIQQNPRPEAKKHQSS
jgi:ankyrin repeat protein